MTAAPRARHDVGAEPVAWRRLLLVALTVLALAAGGLAAAGGSGHGPLAELGLVERRLAPAAQVPAGPAGRTLRLAVDRSPSAPCPVGLRAAVRETRSRVVVGPVVASGPRLGRGCARGRAVVDVPLARPLGRRTVVRAADGTELPAVRPRTVARADRFG